MKNDTRRYAPLGLVLSLLAVLSFIGLLIVRGLSAAQIITLADPTLLDRGIWISVGIIFLGVALAAFLNPEGARSFLFGRQMQYGSNSLIMLIAFIGVLFFINLLVYQNPKSWDWTEGQQNTLAPETLATLKSLPQPVTITAYYSPQAGQDTIRKLLDNFQLNSDGKITYQLIDPVQNPLPAQNDGVTSDGTVVLHMGKQREVANLPAEQDLDSALVRLLHPQQSVIYFVTGHGERDTENAADSAFTLAKAGLASKNYVVKLLNLASSSKVPDDAKAVVIAGPQVPYTTQDINLLEAYLNKGGSVVAMEEPLPLTKMGTSPDPLADMIAKWGITFDNDILIDPDAGQQPLLVYADPQNFGTHQISAKLRGLNLAFFTARSIKLAATPPDGIALSPLAQTYGNAWGETNFDPAQTNQAPTFDATKDYPGPLIMAGAAENSNTKGRLVVFGDADFASDVLYQRGDGTILLNAIDWAAGQENIINLTPKNNPTRTYNPPGTPEMIGIVLTSICLIPLLVIAAGLAAWYSRRRRG